MSPTKQGYRMGKAHTENKQCKKHIDVLKLKDRISKKLDLADADQLKKVMVILVKKGFYQP